MMPPLGPGCIPGVAEFLETAGVGEDGDVKINGFFGVLVEPEEWGDGWISGGEAHDHAPAVVRLIVRVLFPRSQNLRPGA